MLTEQDLRHRVGPVLSDGTALRDLIDFDRKEVSMRVLDDAELHRLELRRLFAREWVAVAHESEMPEVGDYVLRYIGEDRVIVTRSAPGRISILLNVCAHRGMEICWADAGNTKTFKCPYHGWVFGSSGNLLGAPFEREMYGDWDKSQYGLRRARVATRQGIVFGCFDERTPPLDEWLGDIGWYLDHMYGDVDFEPIGSPMRFRVESNWKSACDQFAGDSYHTQTLHRSMFDVGFVDADGLSDYRNLNMGNVKVSTPQGHSLIGFNPMTYGPNGLRIEPETNVHSIEGMTFTGFLFPATQCGDGFRGQGTPPTATIGGVVPHGPQVWETWTVRLVAKDAPDSFKEAQRGNGLFNGMAADDFEGWPSLQRAARGVLGQEQPMRYFSQLGEQRPESWPGPGTVHAGFPKDDSQWRFWCRWFELMTDDDV